MSLLEAFFSPKDRDVPAGIDLRNDPRFHALERMLEPASRAARRAAGGAEPSVDWQGVLDAAAGLAEEGRDLRLMVIVTRALANRDGLAGAAEGLRLLTVAVGDHWEHLHPALRDLPSPADAAVRRINALRQLESDTDGPLCDLEHKVLFSPRGLGNVTGGDLAAADLTPAAFQATLPSGLGAAETGGLLAAHEQRVARVRTGCKALAAETPDLLADLVSGADAARQALSQLEEAVSGHVRANGVGFRLQALGNLLGHVSDTLASVSAVSGGDVAMTNAAAPAPGAPSPGPSAALSSAASSSAASSSAASPAGLPLQISTRQEVERCLDMIIEFYERTEPASPLPLLARRMRKMVPMSFLQLMEEVAPSGMKEFRNVAGVPDEKSK
jgi:type VI secretion system protein ImpA